MSGHVVSLYGKAYLSVPDWPKGCATGVEATKNGWRPYVWTRDEDKALRFGLPADARDLAGHLPFTQLIDPDVRKAN